MQMIDINTKKAIEEIITLGYQRAADSFSVLIHQQVSVNQTALDFCEDHRYLIDQLPFITDLTVVQTDIIGDMTGAGYLVLNPEETNSISEMGLNRFNEDRSVDRWAVLKEIDNVISAAVITELSNAFSVKIYGNVPHLIQMKDINDLYQQLKEGKSGYYLLSYTRFIFNGRKEICPLFIWEIDKKIVELASV